MALITSVDTFLTYLDLVVSNSDGFQTRQPACPTSPLS